MDDEGLGSGAMDGTTSGNGQTERQDRAGAVKQDQVAVRHQDMGSTLPLPRTPRLRQHAGRNWPGPTRKQEVLVSLCIITKNSTIGRTHIHMIRTSLLLSC